MPAKRKGAPTLYAPLSREWRKEYGLLADAEPPRGPVTPPTDEEREQLDVVARMRMRILNHELMSTSLFKLTAAFANARRKRRRPPEDTLAMMVLAEVVEEGFSLARPIPKRAQPRNAARETAKRLKARGVNYTAARVYNIYNSRWGRPLMRYVQDAHRGTNET